MNLGRAYAALAEAVGVKSKQVIRQDLQLACHFALFHLEAHIVDDGSELLIQSVVFEHEEVLGKLLHNLAERQLVDLAVGD